MRGKVASRRPQPDPSPASGRRQGRGGEENSKRKILGAVVKESRLGQARRVRFSQTAASRQPPLPLRDPALQRLTARGEGAGTFPAVRVCVVGKGGAGKSIVAGTIARMVARRGERVLAFDADPMPSGLARSLGTRDAPEPLLADAVERIDGGPWRLKRGIGPVTAVRRYAREAPDGVLMLQLGKITLEDHPKFLAATQAYWQLVRRMDEARTFEGWSFVGDTPAGPRQIAADFSPYADTYVVVVEPTWQSVLTARRAAKLARMRAARVLPVANKVRDDADRETLEQRLGEPVVATIPFDPDVKESDRLGVPLVDHAPNSRAAQAVQRVIERIETPR